MRFSRRCPILDLPPPHSRARLAATPRRRTARAIPLRSRSGRLPPSARARIRMRPADAPCARRCCAAFSSRNCRYSLRQKTSSRMSSRARPCRKSCAEFEQLGAAHGIEANLVEEAQQPRLTGSEVVRHLVGVPHLAGAADELISTRPLHAVDAQVSAADAHRILGGPHACRVVLGSHQPVPGIERRRHGRAKVDVPQAQHDVGRVEHRAS